MSEWRVGGRGVLAYTLLVLSATASSSDTVYSAATDASVRYEGGAKVVRVAPAAHETETALARRTLRIAKGQTLADILHGAGVSPRETEAAVRALRGVANLRRLQVGQRLALYLEPDGRTRLRGVELDIGGGRSALAFRDLDGRFSARRVPAEQAAALLEGGARGDESGPGAITRELVLRKGQTLNRVLIEAGASAVDGHRAAAKIGERVNLRRLQIGQKVTASFEVGAGETRLTGVTITVADGRTEVWRGADGRWMHGSPARPDPRALGPGGGEGPAKAPAVAQRPVVVGLAERPAPTPSSETRTVVLGENDILFDRIVAAGATPNETDRAVRELAKVLDLRKLQIGERFRLTFSAPPGGGRAQLTGLAVSTHDHQLVVLGWPLVDESVEDVADGAPSVTRVAPGPEAVAPPSPPLGHELRTVTVERGDNLTALLARAGVPRRDIVRALHGMRGVYNPNRIARGKRLVIELEPAGGAVRLARFTLETGRRSAVVVERSGDRFSARKTRHEAIEKAITLAEAHGRDGTAAASDSSVAAGTDLEARLNGYKLVELDGAETTAVTLTRGSTLMRALVKAGAERGEAHAAIESVRELYDPRKLRPGNELAVTFVNASPADMPFATEGRPMLGALSLDLGAEKRLEVVRLEDGRYVSGFVEKDLVRDVRRVAGAIESSLYDAAVVAEVPVAVMMKMIHIYSFDVDFQRDLQPGDGFELMYEMLVDARGEEVAPGEILYASMTLSGEVKRLYRFRLADGRIDYFDAAGTSARKALMRTPINGARLSSGFGLRRHPILGYSKMHEGLDFAAPRGTPVYAAGDGVVERASRFGAYGKYVRIRHNTEYSTAYAHLNGFADGVRPGRPVKQGETIGYVGTTGRSTGPHLHYEILRHDKQVNPLSVKMPTGVKLAGEELERFAAERTRLRALYAELPDAGAVAASFR